MPRPTKPPGERRVPFTVYLQPRLLAKIRALIGAGPISAWIADAVDAALASYAAEENAKAQIGRLAKYTLDHDLMLPGFEGGAVDCAIAIMADRKPQ